jgi:chromosomal replication initiation ATPase DnaA
MSEPTPIRALVNDALLKLERGERTPRPEHEAPPAAPIPVPLVPKRFTDVRLETYLAETETERYALRAVKRWVELVAQGEPPMLALVGPQGTGKSHLLYGAAWALHAVGRRCSCFPWYRLADELRYGGASPYNGAPLEAHEFRSMLWGSKAILLDEVRPTAGTSFDDTELAKLACHCYDSHLPVLLTTNVSPLADVLGPAATSRYSQVVLTGRDRRQA